MSNNKFTLGKKDAAWIIRHAGLDDQGRDTYTFEMAFPSMEDDALVPAHITALTGCFLRIIQKGDEKFLEEMHNWFGGLHEV